MNNDIRNLSKWLNEEQESPIDRQALARVLAMAEQPAQQEPVITKNEKGLTLHVGWDDLPAGTKLYTSPPASKPWVGLTDDERGQVYANWRFNGSGSSNLELCRAIEAKLKEKNA